MQSATFHTTGSIQQLLDEYMTHQTVREAGTQPQARCTPVNSSSLSPQGVWPLCPTMCHISLTAAHHSQDTHTARCQAPPAHSPNSLLNFENLSPHLKMQAWEFP